MVDPVLQSDGDGKRTLKFLTDDTRILKSDEFGQTITIMKLD